MVAAPRLLAVGKSIHGPPDPADGPTRGIEGIATAAGTRYTSRASRSAADRHENRRIAAGSLIAPFRAYLAGANPLAGESRQIVQGRILDGVDDDPDVQDNCGRQMERVGAERGAS